MLNTCSARYDRCDDGRNKSVMAVAIRNGQCQFRDISAVKHPGVAPISRHDRSFGVISCCPIQIRDRSLSIPGPIEV